MIKPVLVLTICCLILVFAFSPHVFPFTTDSLIYISTAENIREGNGLAFDNVFVEPPEPDVLALKLHPPGYSFLIALLHSLGFSAYTAALIIPRFFFLLLPMGFFLVFSHMMPRKLSMVTAGLCALMFPYLRCALMAWADIPFLFLSLISFVLIFKTVSTGNKQQLACAFLSGVLTGGALLTRNAGYALVLSIGSGFILMFALKIMVFKKLLKVVCYYLAGFFSLVMPYMIRNYLVFGEVNPYRLPPANVTLSENLADYSQALSQTIFANPFYHGVLLVLMAGMLAWFMAAAGQWIKTDKHKIFCAAVLIIYFLSGSLLVILSKTMYFMPEKINERYLIQYAWIIVAGLSYGVYFLLSKLRTARPIDTRGVTFLILTAFLLVQIFPAADLYFQQKKTLYIAKKVETHAPLLFEIPKDHVIVSNIMDMTTFFSRRDVRLLNGYMPYGLLRILGAKRKFAVFIVKARHENYKSYLYPPAWLKPEGYRRVYSNRDVALWLPE